MRAQRRVADADEQRRRHHEEGRAAAWTSARALQRDTSHAANSPCSVKQISSQGPMYWNVAGSQALNGFSANAASGIESVNPIEVPSGA